MTNEQWDDIETVLDGMRDIFENLNNDFTTKDEALRDLSTATDSLYSLCENVYCSGAGAFDGIGQYEDVLALLPRNQKLSVGDIMALREHIYKWLDERGLAVEYTRILRS